MISRSFIGCEFRLRHWTANDASPHLVNEPQPFFLLCLNNLYELPEGKFHIGAWQRLYDCQKIFRLLIFSKIVE